MTHDKGLRKSRITKARFGKSLKQSAKICVGLAKAGDKTARQWLEKNWRYATVRHVVKGELKTEVNPKRMGRFAKSKAVYGWSVQGGAPGLGKKR